MGCDTCTSIDTEYHYKLRHSIEILGPNIPGFNEMINAARLAIRPKFVGPGTKAMFNSLTKYDLLKEEWTKKITLLFNGKDIVPLDKIFVKMLWCEKTKRRDKDNVCAFIKFILDSLIHVGVIKDDSWGTVMGWGNKFLIGDTQNVKVQVYEVLENGFK